MNIQRHNRLASDINVAEKKAIFANDKVDEVISKIFQADKFYIVEGDVRIKREYNYFTEIINVALDDERIIGKKIILDNNVEILGDFSVSGENVTLDADTNILGDFNVIGAINASLENLAISSSKMALGFADRFEVAPKLGDETRISSLFVFNNKLYGSTYPNGKLYEWNGTDAWVEKAGKLGDETEIYSLAVFNNKLYGGTNINGKLYEWNGTDLWVEKAGKLGDETRIYALAVFNNKLYGSTYPNGKLYEWNGTDAWVEKAGKLGAENQIDSLAVYNNKLYGGTAVHAKLYEWSGKSDLKTGTVEAVPSNITIQDTDVLTQADGYWKGGILEMTSGNNVGLKKLIVGSYQLWKVVKFESAFPDAIEVGDEYKVSIGNWIEVAPQPDSETYLWNLVVYNNKLYGATIGTGKLLEWNNSDKWIEVDSQFGSETDIYSMSVFNDKLYCGSNPNGKLLEWNDKKRMVLAESSIIQNADNIALKVSKDSVISLINISPEGIKIQGDNIQLNGDTEVIGTFKVGSTNCDNTLIDGGKIITGLLTADNIITGGMSTDRLTTGTLSVARTQAKCTDPLADQTSQNHAFDTYYLPRVLGGAGLFCNHEALGFYDGSAWKAYIGKNGNFYFAGDANNRIDWNITEANTLTIKGKLVVDNLAAINANLGNITAGQIVVGTTNKLWLNDSGDGGLAVGGTVKASAPFRVSNIGAVVAKNITLESAVVIKDLQVGTVLAGQYVQVGTVPGDRMDVVQLDEICLNLGSLNIDESIVMGADGKIDLGSGSELTKNHLILAVDQNYVEIGNNTGSNYKLKSYSHFGVDSGIAWYIGGNFRAGISLDAGYGNTLYIKADGTVIDYCYIDSMDLAIDSGKYLILDGYGGSAGIKWNSVTSRIEMGGISIGSLIAASYVDAAGGLRVNGTPGIDLGPVDPNTLSSVTFVKGILTAAS